MKPSNDAVLDRALDLGFKVTHEFTKQNGKGWVTVIVSWEQDGEEFLGGSGRCLSQAVLDLNGFGYGVAESLRQACDRNDELCVRVAEAAEDFCILNRNLEGKRSIGTLSVDGQHDDDHVIAGYAAGGGFARVVYGGEVVADAAAETVPEALHECKRQLQERHEALLLLHDFAAGDLP